MSVKMAILFSAFVPLQYGAGRPTEGARRRARAPGRKARAQSIYFSNEARIAFGDGGRGGDALVAGDLQELSYSTTDAEGADHIFWGPLSCSQGKGWLVSIYS